MRERLLTQHFLRCFLDNDLISPDADRREVLSVILAALLVSGLFVTVFLTLKYLLDPFQTPGRTAILALDDRFFYLSASMILMGLLAVAQWDTLTLDARDASILGFLPIPYSLLLRAKLTAVMLLAVGFTLALNVVPSIVYPSMMAAKLPIPTMDALTLIVAHAVSNITAGAWGFAAVVGVRELLRAVLGPAVFARVSILVQGGLVVALATTFLLLPGLSSGVARAWLSDAAAPDVLPPFWFLGLQETLGGGAMERLPIGNAPEWIVRIDGEARDWYRELRPRFGELTVTALAALAGTLFVAGAAVVWNSRRLPAPLPVRRAGRGRLGAAWRAVAQHLLARPPVTRAGFFFTLQVLARSLPHRLAILTSLAVGLAAVAASTRGLDVRETMAAGTAPLALYAIQTTLLTMLIVGFRHAVHVPAELRANWAVHLAWPGDETAYLKGVKRAAFVGVVLPTLGALSPLHLMTLGPGVAVVHALHGALVAFALIELALLGYRKLPFASAYVPSSNLKMFAPLYLVVFLFAMYALAWIERSALGQRWGAGALVAALLVVIIGLQGLDRWLRAETAAVEIEGSPDEEAQRLDLSG